MNILDEYVKTTPTVQTQVDLFKGEWSSKLPACQGQEIISGHAELFNDQRMVLLNQHFPLHQKRVLELGPLEAGHTYMIHQFGAQHITAVEANSRAYLKCLVVKEIYQLSNAHFLLGDAFEYMKNTQEHFELTVASGILYHSTSPPEFIEQCCRISDRVFIWTHYFNPAIMGNYANLQGKCEKTQDITYKGRTITAMQFDYLASLDWGGFCGGPAPYSLWIKKEEIFEIFKENGLSNIKVFFDDETHPSGPNICFIAERY
jgi:hypothetical protein